MSDEEYTGPLFGPEMLEDPYSVYAELRAHDPVQWCDSVGGWVVTNHEQVAKVLKSRAFSSDRVTPKRRLYAAEYQPAFDVLSRIMLQTDDPVHKHLRNLVLGAFSRTAVHDYHDAILGRCEELLAPGIARGQIEFMSEFAQPLPLMVISDILGVPTEDRLKIKGWCDAFSYLALNFYVHVNEEKMAWCCNAIAEFCVYLQARIEAAGEAPGTDLLSSLALVARDDPSVTMDDVIANCILLLNAGNETTTCLLGSGMRLLMEHPDQLGLLRNDKGLIPGAVEEFLRMEAPVQYVGRVASETLEFGGKRIRKGDIVLAVMAAANRDPAVFEHPDRFDVRRVHNRQVSFGTGPHLCAGIQLARYEAQTACEYLLDRLDWFEPVPEPTLYSSNFNLRSLSSLKMRVRGRIVS